MGKQENLIEPETSPTFYLMEFKATGYLEKSYLGKEGGKHVTLEFSSSDALEIAKLELMGRDLEGHLPVLLEVTIKPSLVGDLTDAEPRKPEIIR